MGTSGAGKSTLVNLLGGFAAPTEGALVVNGEDAGTLGCAAWQKQVVYIPQNPYLFHATLRENIAFYAPDAAEDDIERAVRVMGLEDVVAELPDGLETLIGEGARALSGG
ncbi:ATP-binding cassette domain-containing protein, partial [Eggerthella sinensis]|uniref:ATP-binding cassette domain-containing protein n=1 Tax=Eggerthella sinensis TaxID=242230 RepID=UPI0022DFB2AA